MVNNYEQLRALKRQIKNRSSKKFVDVGNIKESLSSQKYIEDGRKCMNCTNVIKYRNSISNFFCIMQKNAYGKFKRVKGRDCCELFTIEK